MEQTKPLTPLQCIDQMDALHKAYPETELYLIGKSVLEQRIYALEMGNPRAKVRVLVQAGMHGREWLNCSLLLGQMEDYLSKAEYAPLLKRARLLFVPMCNPDGVRIAQEGAGWIDRAAQREEVERLVRESGEGFSQWKANGRGVDLNRNFDAHWDSQTDAKETAGPSAAFYRGEMPESEPETRMLAELTECFHPTLTLSYHSRGEYLYWYFFQTGKALERDRAMAEALAAHIGYACRTQPLPEVDSFAGYKDYCVEKLGIPAFTIETGAEDWEVPLEEAYLPRIALQCGDATAFAALWQAEKDG